jgi:peptidyl-tRNA hydrolase, PTH1 family
MRLIVGLGNPGPEYQWTPHNLGFLAVDEIANRASIRVERPEGKALVGLGKVAGVEVILAKPQTYMNLSGLAVADLAAKLEIRPEADLIVIQDELDFPFGTLRVQRARSSAGHNGIESIIDALGTKDFLRVRIGVAPEHKPRDGKEYLLAPMRKAQLQALDPVLSDAADAVTTMVKEGEAAAMQKFNRKPEVET